MLEEIFSVGLLKIIGVNIVLSGDNAVVIALAARSLPEKQQKQAIMLGASAAVILRIVLTLVAVALLTLPWIKLVGSVLLLWVGINLLLPEAEGGHEVESSHNLWGAMRTILIADLVMSLDNVIAVAAAAGGSLVLLLLGLAISIPIVVFASTFLIRLMGRWPIIITLGAALIGYVAGEMAITDPVISGWEADMAAGMHQQLGVEFLGPEQLCGLLAAAFVVALGTWLARRRIAAKPYSDEIL